MPKGKGKGIGVRLNPRHQAMVAQKIRVGQIINHLRQHMLGKKEMSQTQVRAAEILLKKALPDLKQTEVLGEITHSHESASPEFLETRLREAGLDPEVVGALLGGVRH